MVRKIQCSSNFKTVFVEQMGHKNIFCFDYLEAKMRTGIKAFLISELAQNALLSLNQGRSLWNVTLLISLNSGSRKIYKL